MSWLTDRLEATRGRRPYPLAPLATALGLQPTETTALALALGRDKSWVKRVRRLGLTERQADQWATRAGLHPLDIWPRWAEPIPPMALTNAHKTHCPAGHPYDRIDPTGRRSCSTCTRTRVANWRKKTAKPQATQVVTPLPEAS